MATSYKAFITYSHDDEAWAKWLQRSLERYRVPPRLIAAAARSQVLPERLYPVFRDRTELASSADLSQALKDALSNSEALVVVCSPAAAHSRWVNEEIRYFRSLGRGDRIFCLIVDGDPETDSAACAFPEQLIRADDGSVVEHLAADPRVDGRRDALLKIVGGLLGVGIDDLKQRDAHRRARLFAGMAGLSAAVAVTMIVLTFFAMAAQREAELRRGQAEELIGFMLGDLRGRLEPIGRLDVLDAVGDEAMKYYEVLDENATPQDMLGRAMALRQIGEVRFSQGQLEAALTAFEESRAVLERLYGTDENSNDYLFELAQSEFWVGYVHYQRARYDDALTAMNRYMSFSRDLLEREPDNADYVTELVYAYSNLGSVADRLGRKEAAIGYFRESAAVNERLLAANPADRQVQYDLGGGYSWIGSAEEDLGNLQAAEQAFRDSLARFEALVDSGDDMRDRERLATARALLADNLLLQGNVDEAHDFAAAANDLFRELVERDPDNARWRRGYATSADGRAEMLMQLGRIDEAGVYAGEAVANLRRLHAAEPTDAMIRRQLSAAIELSARWKLASGQTDAAIAGAEESWSLIDPRTRGVDDDPELLATALGVGSVRADIIEATGATARAQAIRQQLLKLFDDARPSHPELIARLARLAERTGDERRADELTAQLADTGFNHPAFAARQ